MADLYCRSISHKGIMLFFENFFYSSDILLIFLSEIIINIKNKKFKKFSAYLFFLVVFFLLFTLFFFFAAIFHLGLIRISNANLFIYFSKLFSSLIFVVEKSKDSDCPEKHHQTKNKENCIGYNIK